MNKQNMPHGYGKIFLHFLFFVTMIGTTLFGVFMFPQSDLQDHFFQRTDSFWIRLIWFEAIIGVFWYAFTGKYLNRFVSEGGKQNGAIYVAVGAVYLKFAGCSLIIWIIGCFLPASIHWQGWVWLLQFVWIIFCAGKLYFISHLKTLQSYGMEDLPESVVFPDDLANKLFVIENSTIISNEVRSKIKKVREKIKYSIPRAGKIGCSENYRLLINEVTDFSELSAEEIASQISSFEDSVMTKILMIQNECKN